MQAAPAPNTCTTLALYQPNERLEAFTRLLSGEGTLPALPTTLELTHVVAHINEDPMANTRAIVIHQVVIKIIRPNGTSFLAAVTFAVPIGSHPITAIRHLLEGGNRQLAHL